MDIVFAVLGCFCIFLGVIGCIAPGLPGPPLSYTGLLFLHFSRYAQFSSQLLWILAVLTLLITMADYLLPIWMTKKLGGTKYGAWGATIGLIIGLFLGPWGIVIGPFIGALSGEIISGSQRQVALKSAWGSFAGFIVGTGAKLIVSGIISFYFFNALWNYWFA